MSGLVLKTLALLAMLLDHIAAVFTFQGYLVGRFFGRIAFPIFAFFVAEGFYYTYPKGRTPAYLKRLLLLAFLSEIPRDLAMSGLFWDPRHQNVLFTLSLGLLTLWGIEVCKKQKKPYLAFLCALLALLLAEGAHFDYGSVGILLLVGFYLLRDKKWGIALLLCLFTVEQVLQALPLTEPEWILYFFKNYAYFLLGYLLDIPLLYAYNGKRGKQTPRVRRFFYWFYPVHLLLLFLFK